MGKAKQNSDDLIMRKALQLLDKGQFAGARTMLLDAARKPRASAEILQLLGVACAELGDLSEAMEHLRRAVKAAPRSVSAHFNLGNLLLRSGRVEEALTSFGSGLALRPNSAELLASCGDALTRMGRHEEATQHYTQAIMMSPGYAHAHDNLGRVLYKLGRKKEAASSLQEAARIEPRNAETLAFLARTLLDLNLAEPATDAIRRALDLVRGTSATGPMALSEIVYVARSCALWTDADRHTEQLLQQVRQNPGVISPLSLLHISDEPELHLACAQQRAKAQTQKVAPLPSPTSGTRRLRIAYVSADYKEHPVALLTAGLFAAHHRQDFEIIGVSLAEGDGSATRERLISGFDHFIDAKGDSAEAICARLRSMEVDIAVDLMGHTEGAKFEIFQNRCAPIQVNFLGYPGTAGAACMDYIVIDPVVGTPRVRANLTEKPVILPDCYLVNDGGRSYPEARPARSELGLPDGAFVFAAFNKILKVTPEIFDLWMRILGKVEGSVLWMSSKNEIVDGNLRSEVAKRGISPDRLVFARHVAQLDDHLVRYRAADLFLDTFPYGGHTTASDALWMGCPVVTCVGESFASRVAGSLLHTVGLPELAVKSLPDYEALAVALADDPKRLSAMRTKLNAERLTTPLFDTNRFARSLERAYWEMWLIHRSEESPREIDLSAASA
jgi:protein O-GlcNAc transferase